MGLFPHDRSLAPGLDEIAPLHMCKKPVVQGHAQSHQIKEAMNPIAFTGFRSINVCISFSPLPAINICFVRVTNKDTLSCGGCVCV